MAPTTAQCREDSPLRCDWRKAVAEADPYRLKYSYEAGCWLLWLGLIPEAVKRCPGCDGVLPQIGPVTERMHREGWVDTYTGEEGG